ncbi:hypothetical protein BSIN_0986 [Burkholderia singularis]|uniref:Uncharacterized protein n=1 Tax=Burkholderia singularis TaxID=1503053 RepID=A0A238HBZ4_9BURK|nr:hypothetical protein BSIN_0986 [Burkholderia singularis]
MGGQAAYFSEKRASQGFIQEIKSWQKPRLAESNGGMMEP